MTDKHDQFRKQISNEPEHQLILLNSFLNKPDLDPNSPVYQEVQSHLKNVQSAHLSITAQRSISVATSSPSSLVTAQSNPLSSSLNPAASIPLRQDSHSISNGAATLLSSSSVPNNPVANPTLQSLDPHVYSVIVPPLTTATESNHLMPELHVSDGLPLDGLVADGPFNSQERADFDPEFEALAALPQSQLIALSESPERVQSLDECDGPPQLANGQQTPPDTGSGWASQEESPNLELLALAELPLSQLLAAGSGAGAASQLGAASQESPDPELQFLAALPLSQLLRAGAEAQEENRHPMQACTASTTAGSAGSPVRKALPPAKHKRLPKSHPPDGPTPSQIEHTEAEGFSPDPVCSRLRVRPVSTSTSPLSSPRRAVHTSAHAMDKQTQ